VSATPPSRVVRPPRVLRDVGLQVALVLVGALLLPRPVPAPPVVPAPPTERLVKVVRVPPPAAAAAAEGQPRPAAGAPDETPVAPPQPRPAAGEPDSLVTAPAPPAHQPPTATDAPAASVPAARAAASVRSAPRPAEPPPPAAAMAPATLTRPASTVVAATPQATPAAPSARGSIRHGATSERDEGLPLEIMLPASTWALESHLRAVGGCLAVVRHEAERDVVLTSWDLLGGRAVARAAACGGLSRVLDDPSFLVDVGDPVGQTRARGDTGRLGVTVWLGRALGAAIRDRLGATLGTTDPATAATLLRERRQVLRCDALADGRYDCAVR
jgi:hypothetical protein